MNSHFEYKGYLGSADVDIENHVLVGRLLFIRDAIGYSAASVEELEKAFREAVDDYLATCAEEGEEPDVPCKGSFNVRVGPARHREAAMQARRRDLSLNEYVCQVLDAAVQTASPQTIVHRHEFSVTLVGEPTKRIATASQPEKWEPLGGTARH